MVCLQFGGCNKVFTLLYVIYIYLQIYIDIYIYTLYKHIHINIYIYIIYIYNFIMKPLTVSSRVFKIISAQQSINTKIQATNHNNIPLHCVSWGLLNHQMFYNIWLFCSMFCRFVVLIFVVLILVVHTYIHIHIYIYIYI